MYLFDFLSKLLNLFYRIRTFIQILVIIIEHGTKLKSVLFDCLSMFKINKICTVDDYRFVMNLGVNFIAKVAILLYRVLDLCISL